jgi:hypothetical protein
MTTNAEVYDAAKGKGVVLQVGQSTTTGCPACGTYPFQAALHLVTCPKHVPNGRVSSQKRRSHQQ